MTLLTFILKNAFSPCHPERSRSVCDDAAEGSMHFSTTQVAVSFNQTAKTCHVERRAANIAARSRKSRECRLKYAAQGILPKHSPSALKRNGSVLDDAVEVVPLCGVRARRRNLVRSRTSGGSDAFSVYPAKTTSGSSKRKNPIVPLPWQVRTMGFSVSSSDSYKMLMEILTPGCTGLKT